MTRYTIRWSLPTEFEVGAMAGDDDATVLRNFDTASSTVQFDSARSLRVAEIRAKKALEQSTGRLRNFMLKRAGLRKAPVLYFEYAPPSDREVYDYGDDF